MHASPTKLLKVNLGCGRDFRDGWVNVDIANIPGVDMVHNVEELPLPFEDASCQEVLCNDILEHVAYIPIVKDLHRILAPGGKLYVRVPHFTSKNNPIDPTHIRTFSVETFDFFDTSSSHYKKFGSYMFGFGFSHMEHPAYIDFEKSSSFFFYNKFIERFVNKSKRRQQLYESTGFSRLFPAQNIKVTYIK